MSWSTQIFVDSEVPIEEFVNELESLLEIRLSLYSRGDDSWYEFLDPQVRLTVYQHDLEADSDMNFEDYPYQISIWGIDNKNPEERERRREDFARFVFQKLVTLQKYPLVLMDNLEMKLDEFLPETVGMG